jgi:phosphatidylglycerol:prolipoprotein diacylglycerol transferase
VNAATITINIDPELRLGPLTVAWHGLTIALGILAGGVVAQRLARRRSLDADPIVTIGVILALGALVGGRLFYLAEHGELLRPNRWLGATGFTFDGGFIAAALGIALYVRRAGLDVIYLDLVAVALPLGVAIGRIGDVINGEHFGPPTTFFLGVRNAHPDALTPRHDIAYHNGGLYEVLLAAAVFAAVWPLRDRLLARRTAALWVVVALFAIGRFFEFFVRSDSPTLALGLSSAQFTSLVMLAAACVGAWWTLRARPTAVRDPPRRAGTPTH